MSKFKDLFRSAKESVTPIEIGLIAALISVAAIAAIQANNPPKVIATDISVNNR
ncbi:MAG: Flp family type IVb pilin [Patescibacteria group bacterium]